VWQPRVQSHVNTRLGTLDIGLVPRQEQDGGSCDRRARCKKKKIRNPSDPSKCIRCPPLMTSDPTRTLCIQDKDVSKDDKGKQYEEKIKEKIKEKMKQFKDKIKERLEKKKEEKTKEWDIKDKERNDRLNQKKARRMAVCLPLVAAAIGTQAMLEMADGGFSTDLLDSIDMDMLSLWPGTDIANEWLDKTLPDDQNDISGESYVDEFLKIGDQVSENPKRSIENQDTYSGIVTASKSAVESTGKRNVLSDIAQFFLTIARAIGAVAARTASNAGNAAARVSKFFSTRKPNLKKPGESKWTRAQQKDKAKEISQSKNWTSCLRGEKPAR
jgi:hypothetical protein